MRFHIYGDGPYKKKIVSLINKENLQKYVKLKGVTNEPEDIFPAYEKAYNSDDGKSTILVEFQDFYNEK